jgi:uncharacterized protein YkwD
LAQAAELRADEQIASFSHTRPNGTSCFTVLDDFGIARTTAGENIAYATEGYYSPQAVVDAWMNSSGHRANILKTNFTSVGIGYAKSDGLEFFVQLFIG